MSRSQRHGATTLLLVTALLMVAVLAGLEWTLARLDADNPRKSERHNPERYLRLREWRPNSRYTFTPPAVRHLNAGGTSRPSYTFTTDADGFIEPSRVHPHPQRTIVFLGGSTTESLFVDEENRFPYRVGRLLEQETGLRINAMNGGKSGNNLMHSLLILTAKVLPLRPDMVVVMHNANDFGVLSSTGHYWPHGESNFRAHLLSAAPPSLREAAAQAVKSLFPYTLEVVREGIKGWKERRATVPPPRPGTPREGAPSPPEGKGDCPEARDCPAWLATYRSAMTQFVLTVQAWGIQPVVMTQVLQRGEVTEGGDEGDYLGKGTLARRGLNKAAVESIHHVMNRIAREVATRHGALLIDLEARVPGDTAHLYDGLHFHDAGARAVAEVITETLKENMRQKPGQAE